MQSFERIAVIRRNTQLNGLPGALGGEFVDDLAQTLSRQLRSLRAAKKQDRSSGNIIGAETARAAVSALPARLECRHGAQDARGRDPRAVRTAADHGRRRQPAQGGIAALAPHTELDRRKTGVRAPVGLTAAFRGRGGKPFDGA